MNGLLTADRKVCKLPTEAMAALAARLAAAFRASCGEEARQAAPAL